MKCEKRQSSRLIVMDDHCRVLLFRYARWSGGTFWATPGGGVDNGETFEQAALREAREELGVTPGIAHYLWERTVDIRYEDHDVHQLERYFRITCESINLIEHVEAEHRQ